MRFERKYRITIRQLHTVKQWLRLHPASFRTLYPDRQINNIYYDSPVLHTYRQNVYGVNERKKYRVRWYGKDISDIKNPQFEIKSKHCELGTKEVIPIDNSSLQELPTLNHSVNKLVNPPMHLVPVLLNSYHRAYFISFDRKFRVTLDSQLRYHSILKSAEFNGYTLEDRAIIMEIKYEQEHDELIEHISQHIPFRQDKHSKYVQGVQMSAS